MSEAQTSFDPSGVLRELYTADPRPFFDDPADEPMFAPPVVAIADAADPLWERLHEIIGPFHWTPQQALNQAAIPAAARSVICWSLPISPLARSDNRRQDTYPARRWAWVRTFGQQMNHRLGQGLIARLNHSGWRGVCPHSLEGNTVRRDPRAGFSSQWSQRHAAFVAGLGTFGISGGLITAHGVAHRLGSVVTDLPLEPTPRPYGDDPFAWCLRAARGTCGACIARCPVGSIGPDVASRDKDRCERHAHEVIAAMRNQLYGWDGTLGCGLCQTAVPCENRNPVR